MHPHRYHGRLEVRAALPAQGHEVGPVLIHGSENAYHHGYVRLRSNAFLGHFSPPILEIFLNIYFIHKTAMEQKVKKFEPSHASAAMLNARSFLFARQINLMLTP
jgi:hypothetical protein